MEKTAVYSKISSFTSNKTYLSVGLALSYWENSEDIRLRIFNLVCAEEPVARHSFLTAPRSIRMKMLRDTLDNYPEVLTAEEIKTVLSALRELDNLALKRN